MVRTRLCLTKNHYSKRKHHTRGFYRPQGRAGSAKQIDDREVRVSRTRYILPRVPLSHLKPQLDSQAGSIIRQKWADRCLRGLPSRADSVLLPLATDLHDGLGGDELQRSERRACQGVT